MKSLAILVSCGVVVASLPTVVDGRPRLFERLREARAARSTGDTAGAVARTLKLGGLDRSYLLLDAHRGSEPAPLVIVLHGGGGSPETMIPRWAARARAAGLVVAAPKGIGRNDRMGTWNAGGCCGEAVSRKVDDVGFVASVIDDVARQVPIDRKRVYVAGFSNGGMLTHRVAIALSDRIAAAAVVSGALFGNEATPRTPVPMLVMHGEQDPVVGFTGGMSRTGFVAKAQTQPFEPVRYSVDFWRAANGCTAAPAVQSQTGVTTESSTGCRGNADVLFYDLPRGGHSWPGSGSTRRMGDGDGPAPIDATDAIWNFFQAHAR
ncbi:extracellular catalytic domain type 1 short-chain-length polyhydroxyalkanoate depolymerase [Sphingomonas sp. VNH70]|uniref:extracellular catalytic domain type 1 short-chain-length polyhydroxyalkanoate depolymerase n=1 Tax=Sphingomonas silueang TaxID=3156617 RepID=UPI0032B560EE